MCGICGIVDFNEIQKQDARLEIVQRMNAAMYHRGPDDDGFFSNEKVSIAMRRLAIIDLESGQQPIYNEDKSVIVICSGEIYNYRALKEELLEKGHVFTTESDTEVIVHQYEEAGADVFRDLKGMFSICIYDLKKEKILIGRDRFGEKPLYYHKKHHILSFSSEIESLLEHQWIQRKLNLESLPYYFRTATIPEPFTLIKNVQSLAPGHYLEITKEGLLTKVYYRPEINGGRHIRSEKEAVDFIKPRLEKAVHSQMASDVPIGAFLTGGIDSSSIVALMQKNQATPIQTFNVKFEEEKFDESVIARKVAEYCGTDHHEMVIPNPTFTEQMFWELIDHIGFPFRDSTAISTYLLSREVSSHVKVALSGDGADELFGGYDIFKWYLKTLKSKNTPKGLRKLFKNSIQSVQDLPFLKDYAKLWELKRELNTSLVDKDELPVTLSEIYNIAEIEELMGGESSYALYRPFTSNPLNHQTLRHIMYYRMMHVLPVKMLVKLDRMSMAHSLEVRTPFLDLDLFEASLEIPADLLIKGGESKYILRSIMKDELPEEVFNKKKSGFYIPMHRYINKEFKALATDLLFDNNPWPNFFNRATLIRIFENGIHKKKSDAVQSVFQSSHQLWMMMQLLGWARRFKIEVE
ncbi:asparagine synthase (glutamine-hydrolyzing) [Portibacter lacus]|uniref:asparagine synthase (glutamine-hydrolyzing) n=1 Tax=Portibacter lacus TaxID=1099794 RepID=A0AA37SMU7_9BACT|nr:asparagine synthase (glutamine-hydrolyzing) [Portibacter lacus]GLR15924.1 asparagine synthetase B [Portibacter lacus]